MHDPNRSLLIHFRCNSSSSILPPTQEQPIDVRQCTPKATDTLFFNPRYKSIGLNQTMGQIHIPNRSSYDQRNGKENKSQVCFEKKKYHFRLNNRLNQTCINLLPPPKMSSNDVQQPPQPTILLQPFQLQRSPVLPVRSAQQPIFYPQKLNMKKKPININYISICQPNDATIKQISVYQPFNNVSAIANQIKEKIVSQNNTPIQEVKTNESCKQAVIVPAAYQNDPKTDFLIREGWRISGFNVNQLFDSSLESFTGDVIGTNSVDLQSQEMTNAKIDDFQIGELLGKGSNGSVYVARHSKTGFFFALKKINKRGVHDIDQLIVGIRGQFFMQHPNLNKIYACFHDDTNIYLLMQLCVDGHLGEYRKHITTDRQRKMIMLGIARGVNYMHKHCLRHGDLKLENVLACHGFSKITDFECIFAGKSEQFSQIRRRSKLWGSPAYYSPQMMSECAFALEDDIWSVGIIMYELYCGYAPFSIKKAADLNRIVNEDMKPFPEHVDKPTQNLIRRMLDKNRLNRPRAEQIIRFCTQDTPNLDSPQDNAKHS